MGQGPALEELKDCQGKVTLMLNTSQILISSLCALIILLKQIRNYPCSKPLKSNPFALKNGPALNKPSRLSEVAKWWTLAYIRHAMFYWAPSAL